METMPEETETGSDGSIFSVLYHFPFWCVLETSDSSTTIEIWWTIGDQIADYVSYAMVRSDRFITFDGAELKTECNFKTG